MAHSVAREQSQLFAAAVDTARPRFAVEPVQSRSALRALRAIGVVYEPEFLAIDECERLLADIDARDEQWRDDLQRRVQHYGWRYDYKARAVTEDMRLGPLPDFILPLAERLREGGWFAETPDQVIVNEYEPGQGIAAHVDRDCFGPAVATLSLGDRWPMRFTPPKSAMNRDMLELFLDVGSMMVFTDAARTSWCHCILPRRGDPDGQGGHRKRRRRVSVTFRTVVER